MARGVLVAWLSFGVLIGPNVCCCAVAQAVRAASPAKSPVQTHCCCKTKKADRSEKGCPSAPHPDGECPCKKGGKKDLAPQSNFSQLDAAIHWLSRVDLAAAAFELRDFVAPDRSPGALATAAPREGGPRALALCPVLRC